MRRVIFAAVLTAFCLQSFSLTSPFQSEGTASAQEIGFIEEFALSEDRDKTLQKLVPGTEDYYYFHCLHYLNTEKFAQVDEMLKPWIKRSGYTSNVQQIRNRLALLRYNQDPKITLDHLTKTLNLSFTHQREIPQTQRDLPTALDQNLISPQQLLANALSRYQNTDGIENVALEVLAESNLNRDQLWHLLQRIQYPDFPNLVDLIDRDFREREQVNFGDHEIHRRLTVEQMDQLVGKQPKFLDDNNFVNTYLTKLHPSNDVDWQADDTEHEQYLDRLWSFVKDLNPKFNSLKACILFRRLELDLKRDKHDKERFLTYVSLPRQVGYINPLILKQLSNRETIVDLGANYQQQTLLPPIQYDEPVVSEYLQKFLEPANNESEFRPFIETNFLRRQFATAKILAGLGDSEKWATMLSPDEYKQLVNRVDLEFANNNTEFFDVDQPVKLSLFTKNVDKLIVKVFEINTFNYYKKFDREIDTDISLDGLVPNSETTHTYNSAPALQVKRDFDFDQINRRGVYVVDFIGGGKSCRPLIRKGRLSFFNRTNIAGQSFTVLDDAGQIVTDANLWIAGRRYDSDDQGKIQIPFSNSPGRETAIVTSDGFSCLQSFDHQSESYQLRAAMYVDRQSLLRGSKAQLLIRPSLLVSNNPAPLRLLKNIQLLITTENLDGLNTTKAFEDLELVESSDTVVTFQVPPRLKTISFRLTARVENISGNRTDDLAADQSYVVNLIDQSDEIQDVHLVPHEKGYALEVLGKSGEARPKQSVRLTLKPVGFKDPVSADLQSEPNGLIQLGPLDNIDWIEAAVIGGSNRRWQIFQSRQTHYRTLHTVEGRDLQIPAPEGIDSGKRDTVGLLEIRQGQFVADHFSAIQFEDGAYRISGLKRGDYQLRLKPTSEIVTVRVTAGTPVDHIYLGQYRSLESRGGSPVLVENITTDKDSVTIQLKNENKYTRVHVIASRYFPRFGSYQVLNPIGDIEPWSYTPPIRRSAYMSGRQIGDEYQYILDRKYAMKYPGNMLQRPSLLLDPWAVRETQNNVEQLAEGGIFSGAGNDADGKADQSNAAHQHVAGLSDFSNLDFMDKRSVLFANLLPDENGRLEIARADLAEHQHIRVVVVDAFSTAERSVNLELAEKSIRDLRLINAMDPSKNFSQTKQIDVLKKGDPFAIEDILSAKFQYYDDLSDVYTLLSTLNPDPNFQKFQFILEWPELSEEKKLELYAKHACHELNFFLMKKDLPFFRTVVARHITNKRDKTFLDQWFLRENLAEFVDPWKYDGLNVVEKILLSQRLEERRGDIARNVDELYQLRPTPRTFADMLFDSSMISGNDTSFDDAKESKKLSELKNKFLPPMASTRELGRATGEMSGEANAKKSNAADGGTVLLGGIRRPSNQPSFFGEKIVMDAEREDQDEGRRSGGQKGQASSPAFDKSIAQRQLQDQLKIKANAAYESGAADAPAESDIQLRKRRGENGESETYYFEMPETESLFAFQEADRIRASGLALYRRLPSTREWIENNYWHLTPEQQNSDLVTTNQFWRDYAKHTDGPFVSSHFAESTRNFTEMMFALAVLDLPFESPEHKFDYVDNRMDLSADGTIIALHQQVRPAMINRENTKILVSENFFQKNDRYQYNDGVQFDKFISGKFNAHTLYGGQVVITNPTSTPQATDLLIQIPKGAVPASGTQETRTIQMDLAAFSTQTFEYFFYFPTAGDFTHFPAHVSNEETVLAVADAVNFQVVDQPADVDKTSWQFVSQNGTDDQVIEYINQNNVLRLDLGKIAFRMKDETFFKRAVDTLRNRLAYHHTLWSYAILHNDKFGLQEYLKYSDPIVTNVGYYFESELLIVNPVERDWYYHREYSPLVNARIHQVGAVRQILNPAFHTQYHQLMTFLANRKKLGDDERLVVTYYMLLQDRIEEAFNHFNEVNVESLLSIVQYQYCRAYLAMYMEKPEQAKSIAELWTEYPVEHWKKRFQSIIAQVDEAGGEITRTVDDKDNTQKQTELASTAESFDFKIEAKKAKVEFQNIAAITVNYYEMDIELLFSRNPFAQDDLEGFSMIRPNLSQNFDLPKTEAGKPGTFEFDLPQELGNKNVLVEIVGADQTRSQSYFANSLTVQMIENYGQLRVTGGGEDKLLAKTYIKVYSRQADGSAKFHKDGYTDLRGRFDYVSQSNNSIDNVEKYSILILHPEFGAIIRQVDPPKE